jgi:acetylornithine deacetylase
MIRLIESGEDAEKKLRRIVNGRATLEVVSRNDPYMMHVVDGFSTTVVSFGSDVPYLPNLGKPLLVGPGSILDAHTADEKISKRELLEGADLYDRLVRRLLGVA